MEKNIFLQHDETYYLVKIFHDNEFRPYERILLKAKTFDITMINDQYPVVALFEFDPALNLENKNLSMKDFSFKEWAFIKPRKIEVSKVETVD